MRTTNLVVRFLLELTALAALGYWGWRAGETMTSRVLLGLGAPLLFVAVWGAFIAPKATRRMPDPPRLLLEIALFALVAAAVFTTGLRASSLLLAIVAAVNLILMLRWQQRGM